MATKKKASKSGKKKAAPAKKSAAKKPKKAAPKKAAPKKAAPKKAAPKKAAPKKAASKKAAPKKAASKKAAPKAVAQPKHAPKKAAAKLAAKAAPKKAAKAVQRRDATGHLNPRMAADLRRRSRADRVDNRTDAFIHGAHSEDALAEVLGEEAVTAMTGGDDTGEDLNELQEEELGGPFVSSTGKKEYGRGVDASNPQGAEREPFPKV